MKSSILKVLKYFDFFKYQPTEEEIYTFLEIKTTRRKLKQVLKGMQPNKKSNLGHKIAKLKLIKVSRYISFLSLFPQIKLLGLSGTLAMMYAGKSDDVDLFIITAKNRLWTGRFIALITAILFGLKRKRGLALSQVEGAKDKVCLNLFFDEREMSTPAFKRTEYVAHEILQMKPILVRGNIYERFLKANEWVFNIFPNARQSSNFKAQISNQIQSSPAQGGMDLGVNLILWILKFGFLGAKAESFLRRIQLFFIRRHQTTEIVTENQLWFHPVDFEKKLSGRKFIRR